MFDTVLDKILEISRDAWVFLTGLLVVVAILGGLWYALQGAAGAAFGGGKMTAMAIMGAIGIVIMVMVAFLVIPEMSTMLQGMQPTPPF
ncbi:MAG: hypothetical protein U9Q82_06315 [Chloroflexota bacterium]|nr:hypothetical protein [Chloroflexota bacterium]